MTHVVDIAACMPLSANDGAGHSPCGSRWAVCQTHPQAERWALANLTRQGYQAYLPLITVNRRDRVTATLSHSVQVPLFASYVFVQPSDPWAPIAHTLGVSKLLMAGNHPHYLPAGLVEALQAGEALLRTHPSGQGSGWPPGTPCALGNAMPMGGLPAVVLARDRNRVKIGIMFLGDVRVVSVPPECLVKRSNDEP